MTIENPTINEQIESANTSAPSASLPNNEGESTAPKKRGRPRKNPETLNAESVGNAGASSSSGPKKRSGKMSGEQIGNLAKQLQGIHMIAATITNLPEVMLHEKEAEMLAGSIANMASQYDLSLDGKTGAAIQLLATAAMIYTPRYFQIRARMNQPVQGTVVEVSKDGTAAS